MRLRDERWNVLRRRLLGKEVDRLPCCGRLFQPSVRLSLLVRLVLNTSFFRQVSPLRLLEVAVTLLAAFCYGPIRT